MPAPMIIMMEIPNCKTTKPFLTKVFVKLVGMAPFTMVMG